jgi:hypothetical protein
LADQAVISRGQTATGISTRNGFAVAVGEFEPIDSRALQDNHNTSSVRHAVAKISFRCHLGLHGASAPALDRLRGKNAKSSLSELARARALSCETRVEVWCARPILTQIKGILMEDRSLRDRSMIMGMGLPTVVRWGKLAQ